MDRIHGRHQRGHQALRHGRASLPHQIYHVTAATRGRRRIFIGFEAASTAAATITSSTTLGDATLLAWVLMPDHAHFLLQLGAGDSLARVMGRIKTRSAAAVNHVIGMQGALWSRAYHDHALRDEEDLRAVARYIIANPLRAGLVSRVGDYPFWDAVWLHPNQPPVL
jgi:REP element-mobilizing transposase RayT